jgi:PTS system nitrogen regulatory IIA component
VGVFVKLKTPIPFDAPDGQPVGMLFVLLVPEQATDLHLQILGELAQLFSDDVVRQRLASCGAAEELHRHIVTWSPNAAG